MASQRSDAERLTLKVVGRRDLPATKASIASTPLPETDPIGGRDGAV